MERQQEYHIVTASLEKLLSKETWTFGWQTQKLFRSCRLSTLKIWIWKQSTAILNNAEESIFEIRRKPNATTARNETTYHESIPLGFQGNCKICCKSLHFLFFLYSANTGVQIIHDDSFLFAGTMSECRLLRSCSSTCFVHSHVWNVLLFIIMLLQNWMIPITPFRGLSKCEAGIYFHLIKPWHTCLPDGQVSVSFTTEMVRPG